MKGHIVLMRTGAPEEIIHDVRVEFKKLRALIRLSGKTKIPKSLKDLYIAAGRVRDLQLQQHVMMQQPKANELNGYFTLLGKQLLMNIEILKEKSALSYDESFSHILAKTPKRLSHRQAKNCISKNINGVDAIISLRYKKDEYIHEGRKMIKDLMYSFHHLSLLGLKKTFPLNTAENKTLHELSDELGKFQDSCSTLQLLRVSIVRNLPELERKILARIRLSLMQQKMEQKKNILLRLSSLSTQNGFFKKWKTQ